MYYLMQVLHEKRVGGLQKDIKKEASCENAPLV